MRRADRDSIAPAFEEANILTTEGLRSTKIARVAAWQANKAAVEAAPRSYTTSSEKEALCMQYLADFKEQFYALHPQRNHLLLTVPNEFGVSKFVCSTLRPTELPFRQIYDMDNCIDFVAHYLHYEPLQDPCAPPACLPSPAQVLQWTVGDSFDFAVVLASFLLGAGYDAFVAYGTAPYWMTTRDQTHLACPLLKDTSRLEPGSLRHENGIGITTAGRADAKDEPFGSSNAAGAARPPTLPQQHQQPARTADGDARANSAGGSGGGSEAKGTDDMVSANSPRASTASGAPTPAATAAAPATAQAHASAQAVAEPKGGSAYSVAARGAPRSKFAELFGAKEGGAGEGKDDKAGGRLHEGGGNGGGGAGLGEVARRERDAAARQDAAEMEAAFAREKRRDALHGKRVHAWVVVRGGKRDVDSIWCVEPTTGRRYPASACPYLSVEAIFNASNFWVNMQTAVPPSEVSYDLRDTALWEYVFIDHDGPNATMDAAGPLIDDELGGDDGPGGASSVGGGEGGGGGGGRRLRRRRGSAGAGAGSSGGAALPEEERDVLDLPPSWVSRLAVSHDLFARRYPPDGCRTVLYRRSKLELFADGLNREGVVVRLTLYADDARTHLLEVRELFAQRRDKLRQRVRTCSSASDPGCLYELFLPGRVGALKEVTEHPGQQRILTFYWEARLDGLKRRTEAMRTKIVELFEGRSDRLTYRSINLLAQGEAEAAARGGGVSVQRAYMLPSPDSIMTTGGGAASALGGSSAAAAAAAAAQAAAGGSGGADMEEQMVGKMTEKYARNERVPAERDVAKRTFYVTEGRIRTLYHYARDRVTRTSRMHWKDNRMNLSAAAALSASAGNTSLYADISSTMGMGGVSGGAGAADGAGSGDGGAKAGGGSGAAAAGGGGTSTGGEQETLQEIIAAEKECFTASRHLHLEMLDLQRTRLSEETSVLLVKPIHDVASARRKAAEAAASAGAGVPAAGAKEAEGEGKVLAAAAAVAAAQQMDYLTPFLSHVADAKSITREEAARARDACLRSLKDRLLERANIINTRLNEENSVLAKRQAAFQRNQRDNDGAAEEEFEQFCAEAMFKIQILEQRLVSHESTALKKYAELDAKLASDPRLVALGAGAGH